LRFLAEHQVVLERHVATLIGSSLRNAQRRLGRLTREDYLARWEGFERDRYYQIQGRGLKSIGSDLPLPQHNRGDYRHDAGVAALWLAARAGAFGRAAEVLGERRIYSHDGKDPDEPYAIRLGGYNGSGVARRHYPDLLLIDSRGRRLAIELELSRKKTSRWAEILAGYGADGRLDGVVYVVEDHRDGRSIGRSIATLASRMDLGERVHVRRMSPMEGRGDSRQPPSAARAPVRDVEVER
jgi:hypothetical protein